jgi:aspartate/methionine/tyrosine aminotransferase
MGRLPALEIAERAAALRARGGEVLNIIGVPVLPMPPHVVAAAADAAPRAFPRQSRGWPELRRALSGHLRDVLAVTADPDTELLITHGAQHGMSLALRALLAAGDEVVVPAPTYFYDGTLRSARLTPVYVATSPGTGWALDPDALRRHVTRATRAILLCNPNNPTGNVPTAAELAAIVDLAREHNLLVFSDESYERYVHEGAYTPIAAFGHVHDQLVTVTSMSKNYAFTNWRIGYLHAPAGLTGRIHETLEWDSINVGDVPQAAAVAALEGPQEWILGPLSSLKERRDILHAALSGAGVPAVLPPAGVFLFADLAGSGLAGRDLESALLAEGIPAVAGDAFSGYGSHGNYARLMYGSAPDVVAETGRRAGRLIRARSR